jgi:hypothetical protein
MAELPKGSHPFGRLGFLLSRQDYGNESKSMAPTYYLVVVVDRKSKRAKEGLVILVSN